MKQLEENWFLHHTVWAQVFIYFFTAARILFGFLERGHFVYVLTRPQSSLLSPLLGVARRGGCWEVRKREDPIIHRVLQVSHKETTGDESGVVRWSSGVCQRE